MQGILANFFDGSFAGMVSFLCNRGDLSAEEREAAIGILSRATTPNNE